MTSKGKRYRHGSFKGDRFIDRACVRDCACGKETRHEAMNIVLRSNKTPVNWNQYLFSMPLSVMFSLQNNSFVRRAMGI